MLLEKERSDGRDAQEGRPRFQGRLGLLVREKGKPVAQVARALGIHDGTLANWINADRHRREGGQGGLSEGERAELARLLKENAEPAMRCDVLKRISVARWVSEAKGR